MGRYLDIARSVENYEINELNEISPSAAQQVKRKTSFSRATNLKAEERRKAAVDMLAQEPGINYAFISDDGSRRGCGNRDVGDSWQRHMRATYSEAAI